VIFRHFIRVSLKSILAEALNDNVFTPDGYRGNDSLYQMPKIIGFFYSNSATTAW